jgi:hypothetical protein
MRLDIVLSFKSNDSLPEHALVPLRDKEEAKGRRKTRRPYSNVNQGLQERRARFDPF